VILSEDEAGSEMMDSYISEARPSLDNSVYESIDEGEDEDLTESMLEDDEYDGEDETIAGRVTPPRDTSVERRLGGNTPKKSGAR
jgi:hypothetical protein